MSVVACNKCAASHESNHGCYMVSAFTMRLLVHLLLIQSQAERSYDFCLMLFWEKSSLEVLMSTKAEILLKQMYFY